MANQSDLSDQARQIIGVLTTSLDESISARIVLTAQVAELTDALNQLASLAGHYAGLLNQYDGGRRIQFASGAQWVDRLRTLGLLRAEVERMRQRSSGGTDTDAA